MAFQMIRNFFGQGSPSRSGAHKPVIESESFGNQGGTAHYDTRDVGKTAIDSNWLELARHDKETNEEGRKPHNIYKWFILPETRVIDYIFAADSVGLDSLVFT